MIGEHVLVRPLNLLRRADHIRNSPEAWHWRSGAGIRGGSTATKSLCQSALSPKRTNAGGCHGSAYVQSRQCAAKVRTSSMTGCSTELPIRARCSALLILLALTRRSGQHDLGRRDVWGLRPPLATIASCREDDLGWSSLGPRSRA